jgi:hypothetical protein
MKKSVRFASDIRFRTVLSGGIAVLLSACGGNAPDAAPLAEPAPQLAGVTYNGTLCMCRPPVPIRMPARKPRR